MMRINPDYILREIAGEYILVPSGDAAQNMNGLINLNRTAAFIWKLAGEGLDDKQIVEKVLDGFEIDKETAEKDVHAILQKFVQAGMMEKE